jgi:hypothetical protein
VDAGLHRVQGKAEYVTDGLPLLQELYRDKLADLLRHESNARLIGQYDINNTYQYVINREEVQLSWLARAIVELGGSVDQPGTPSGAPQQETRSAGDQQRVLEEDIRGAAAFVERWRPRLEAMGDARRRGTLNVILGETLEHKRFFEQAMAGETELLGRRTEHVGPRVGEVLPTRWIE